MAQGIKKVARRSFPPARPQPVPQWLTRRNAVFAWVLGLALLVGIVAYPVSTTASRMACVILGGAVLAGVLGLGWRYAYFRWTLITLYLACMLFLVMPGRSGYDRFALRVETVRSLMRYEGVRYYSGGENALGMDCSGLVRRGAIDALALTGLRTLNPLLFRKAAALWWHDTSAREMMSGAGGKAQRLYDIKGIAGADDSRLHPGDFAVIENGIHAAAYLGDHAWLEADPDVHRVIRVNVRSTDNPWFHGQSALLRWKHLEVPQLVGRRRGMQ